jgi:Cu+-exporting ATPase
LNTTVETEFRLAGAHPFDASSAEKSLPCFHCGTPCRNHTWEKADKAFCCQGCLTVFELLSANGLTEFYQLSDSAGVRVFADAKTQRFKFLNEPKIRQQLVDYADNKLTHVTFQIPAIHCIACVWLLENLFRLNPGIGQSVVNFPRKEVTLRFSAEIKLSEVAALLTSLGYEPELKLSALDAKPRRRLARRLWIQLGLAGFSFGNIMLFSISAYLGLDTFAGPNFRRMTGILSLLLACPVVSYSALDYWRSAWVSLRERLLNIDVPIAAGIAAIFVQSSYEVLIGKGDGYFDSLCGLIFFLLCGRLFQQKTFDRLAFDRDYKSFFPISVTRRGAASETDEEHVSLSQLEIGDRLIIRNGELIPADSRLIRGQALVDYSFVTGEAEPIEKHDRDYLYAGGRQMAGVIEVETVKAVSQSYLTSLWNQEAPGKAEQKAQLNSLTNTYSQRFTKLVLAVAFGAAAYWAVVNPVLSIKAFASVLIVACPCALALAAPFALGTAQRVLGRRKIFLKNPDVLETLARVNSVVFDKTGTLTASGATSISWLGAPLRDIEKHWLQSMARQSSHPQAARLALNISNGDSPIAVRSFQETPGCGMQGIVEGHEIWMGSQRWLESRGALPCDRENSFSGEPTKTVGSTVHVAIDRKYRGHFVLANTLRPDSASLVSALKGKLRLALLSGDNERERERFESLFGPATELRFNQTPFDKVNFIEAQQKAGHTVMMVGDGLNDAGALKQSDAGVAVVENTGTFSPASDVIVTAGAMSQLADVLRYALQSVRAVRAAFLISTLYNIIGVSIAASGRLSPIVCAILMPLSSATVVAFACGATSWLGWRTLGHVEAKS